MTEIECDFLFILDYSAFSEVGGVVGGSFDFGEFTPFAATKCVVVSHESIRCAESEDDLEECDLSHVPDYCPYSVDEVRSFSSVLIASLTDYDFPPSLNEEHTYLCALAKMTEATIVSAQRNYSLAVFKEFAARCGVSVIEVSEALRIVRDAA